MKIHPREKIVGAARIAIREAITVQSRGLTDGEFISVLNSIISDELGYLSKMMIREERHGNTEDPGGLL